VLVEERRWLAPGDFAEVVALCQFLPGPNIGNATIVLGRRWFGLRGALTAFLGLMALPFCWVLVLAHFYSGISSIAGVKAVVSGVGIAGAGLFIGTAFKLAKPLARRPAGLAIVAGVVLAAALARLSLVLVLPVAVAFALVAAQRRLL
jgi:chromate transporter